MPAPQVEITHRQEFSAGHRLYDPRLAPEENRRRYGICADDHGHNYAVEVTVRGPVPSSGMVMDLKVLGEILHEHAISRMDHRHLNRDVPFLSDVIPTAENVAVAVWRQIETHLEAFEGCRLHRIRVYESRNNFVDYLGPNPVG